MCSTIALCSQRYNCGVIFVPNITKTIVAAVAVLGVVVVTVATLTIQLQQAEAAPPSHAKCPPRGGAFNASQGRCFHP
jgi:hypothetical protein